MSVVSAIKDVVSDYMGGIDFTDIAIGTVTSTNPLRINIAPDMPDIPTSCIRLTDAVIEKKLVMDNHNHAMPNLSHTHTVLNATTSIALGQYNTLNAVQLGTFYTNGYAQEVDSSTNTIYLNKGLATGDKVLMLKVLNGQNFIVLSKIIPAYNPAT